MDRHLTVSGFVVHEGRVALHWHRKIGAWLPAGGHIEPGEDPVQATLREVQEEFAVETRIIPTARKVPWRGGPGQIEPPATILECAEGPPGHLHIDLVYFLECIAGYPGVCHDAENPIQWVDEGQLAAGFLTHDGVDVSIAPDVQALGLEALRVSVDSSPIVTFSASASTPA